MKQFKLIIIIFIFFLMSLFSISNNVSGLEYYGIEDTIKEDMSVSNIITLKFDSPISRLDYQLGFKIYNLTASGDFDSVECETSDINEKSIISCNFIGMTKEKSTLILSFDTKNGIKKLDGKYRFSINYGISLPIKRVFVVIKLPENSILAEEIVNQSYVPRDGKTMTDGKHIMVYWDRVNLTSGDNLQFSVLYSKPTIVPNYLIVYLTVIIIIVMIIIAIYMKGVSKSEPVVTSVLNEDERKIVNILDEHGGKAYQKILVKESNFSKAKISRLVKNLKERNVIDIEPVSGRENMIILKIKKKQE